MNKIKNIIITEEEIAAKVKEAGRLISAEYDGKPLLLVSVLTGAFIFLADLCRALTIPCEIGFIRAESYSGTESTGNVKITLDIAQDVEKFHVLLVEDILDSGRTISETAKYFKAKKPLSFKTITLLDKPERRVVDYAADYTLFKIPDLFAVGYGLDCDGKYRNLPYIGEYSG